MPKLQLQYFGHMIHTDDSLEKFLMLRKIEGRREEGVSGWDGWMASTMQWTWTWANSGRWWGTGRPGVLQSMVLQRVRHDGATEQQQQQHRERKTGIGLWYFGGCQVQNLQGRPAAWNPQKSSSSNLKGICWWNCLFYEVSLFPLKHSSDWRRPTLIMKVRMLYSSFPGDKEVKNLPANAGETRDVGSIPGWRRTPGGGHGNPLQYFCLENPIDRGAWQATESQRYDWSDLACMHYTNYLICSSL